MVKVLRNWLHRYFSDEQAVVLAVLLVLGFAVVLTLGGMLAPVLTGLVQPYASRPMGNERPAMRLQLTEPGRYVAFVRLQSRSSQSLAVSAWDTVSYLQSRQHKRLSEAE